MFSRIALAAAAGLLAAACASTSATAPGDGAVAARGGASSASPAPAEPVGTTLLNIAATSYWVAEEKLIPDDPLLALVENGATDADNPKGILIVCNAANGGISVRVGKQDATRAGQSATYRIRTGASMREVNGKFVANTRSADTDFVFPISSADLVALGQLDIVSFVSDKGEVEWSLVKDAGAQVQAKHIGSLKQFPGATREFLDFCNPK
jgi:hypothetical protein